MKKFYSLFILIVLFATTVQAQSVGGFINEVNYLASNPSHRGFEIAGEAGSNLDGWSAVIYSLSGTVSFVESLGNQVIPGQQNGYGTIWYDVDQNSNGGGIALINPNGGVEQFISYGSSGAIEAIEGAAAGLTSQFIGQQIHNNKALQLVGVGLYYLDFLWAVPGNATRGGVNVNQILGMIPPVIIAANDPYSSSVLAASTKDINTASLQKERAFDVSCYPNPVTDRLVVRTNSLSDSQDESLQIIDIKGNIVYNTMVSGQLGNVEFDMSHLPSGQYIIRLGGSSEIILKQ